MFICHYIRIQIYCKLCITNSYVTTSEFTIPHISWQYLHHIFESIVELLRNSFNFFMVIASDKIRHFFATMAARFTMTRHILFGGSGHTVSQFGKESWQGHSWVFRVDVYKRIGSKYLSQTLQFKKPTGLLLTLTLRSISLIVGKKADHRTRGVLELLCKKNLDQKTQNWRSSPSPVFGQTRIRTLTLTFEVKLTVTLY